MELEQFSPRRRPLLIVLAAALVVSAVVATTVAGRNSKGRASAFQSDSGSGSPREGGGHLPERYLMLVNTAVASKLHAQELAQFDRSPYDGLAVSFADAYDASAVQSVAGMESRIAAWKKSTSKDIWPWVYLNRMIGGDTADASVAASRYINVPYFQRIPGIDLEDKAGARKDFLENWRNAFRVARDTRIPGIVFDPEFYNNYSAYDLGELARLRGRPPKEVMGLLRNFGARLAVSAAQEYPGATVWFLFTGFTRPNYRQVEGQPTYLAATYIVEGMLNEIQQEHLSLHVLAGGEVGLGYCHASEDDLRQAIENRSQVFGPLVKHYDGFLELAGTMTLWSDRSAKRSWVAQGACGASSAQSVEELEPYMEILFRSYRYNWIYGSPNGGYVAFQQDSAARFDAAIAQAKSNAWGGKTR